jgi:hypothetical protein
MGLYEFIIKDKDGNSLASLDGARGRYFNTYLNKSGSAGFTISPKDPVLTSGLILPGYSELYIYRAGVLVWGGEIVYTRTDVGTDSENIAVTAKGFLDLLSKRVVGTASTPRTFTSTDSSDIAWTIIDESQDLVDGDFGITRGADPTTVNRDRSYSYKNLKEAIEGLSNENIQGGFDFEVTADKKFNVFYPTKGRQISDVVFEWGVNIVSFYQTLDAADMANQVTVLGSGEGSSMITATRNADTYLQETYRLRQEVLSHKDVSNTTTLNGHGDKYLAEHAGQIQITGITTKGDMPPTFGSYEVGDSVAVKIKYGIVNTDSYFRIYGINVNITDNDEETIQLIFNPS